MSSSASPTADAPGTADIVHGILDKYRGNRNGLIAILVDLQAAFGYLPESALRQVAGEMNRTLTEVYGVASFYKTFSFKPRGRHLVQCCMGTACHVRGAPDVAEELHGQLGVPTGETTADGEFTPETVNCVGACALGPIVVVDGHYFSHVRPSQVGDILAKTRRGLDRVELESDERVIPLAVRCQGCNHTLMDADNPIDGHPSIRLTAAFGRKHGSMRLSSLYGSYNFMFKHELPDNAIVNFFCPHCHRRLVGAPCVECGAPKAAMFVGGGGTLQFCTRRGCKNHLLDLGEHVAG